MCQNNDCAQFGMKKAYDDSRYTDSGVPESELGRVLSEWTRLAYDGYDDSHLYGDGSGRSVPPSPAPPDEQPSDAVFDAFGVDMSSHL